ncbi:Imidazole glycerol phosphate synthase subunit HisH, partial [termite gut metagenome]
MYSFVSLNNKESTLKVVIIKYNAGNICSVDYALKRLGVEAEITADKETLLSADKVIFPGVGEAGTTMDYLRNTGLNEWIKNLRQPVLGICLGMQLLCRYSEEGDTNCL